MTSPSDKPMTNDDELEPPLSEEDLGPTARTGLGVGPGNAPGARIRDAVPQALEYETLLRKIYTQYDFAHDTLPAEVADELAKLGVRMGWDA